MHGSCQFAAPAFDDDDKDMLVISKTAASGNATQNFLNSVSKLPVGEEQEIWQIM